MKKHIKVVNIRADGTVMDSMEGVKIPPELSRRIAPLQLAALRRKALNEARKEKEA